MTDAVRGSDADGLEPIRPARPASVELAAAILMVSGAVQLILAVATPAGPVSASASEAGAIFTALALALDVASIALGLLIRLGRGWLLTINVAAVLGFLDLSGAAFGSTVLPLVGVSEVVAVAILLARKPWFDAMSAWRILVGARRRRA